MQKTVQRKNKKRQKRGPCKRLQEVPGYGITEHPQKKKRQKKRKEPCADFPVVFHAFAVQTVIPFPFMSGFARSAAFAQEPHSHSIVAGGLLVMSSATLLIPGTSLQIRRAMRSR